MMYPEQTIKTAINLVDELTKTQTYLLSGACPESAEPILVANQTFLLGLLSEHFEESIRTFNISEQIEMPNQQCKCKH